MKVKIRLIGDTKLPVQHGNWIDLSSREIVNFKNPIMNSTNKFVNFDSKLIPLGIAMTLPKWYKAEIKPRSSMFKNTGLIQTNSIGEIEADYSLEWLLPVVALKESSIFKGDRLCQFQIKLREDAPWYAKIKDLFRGKIKFEEVDIINSNRGGFGSTGK